MRWRAACDFLTHEGLRGARLGINRARAPRLDNNLLVRRVALKFLLRLVLELRSQGRRRGSTGDEGLQSWQVPKRRSRRDGTRQPKSECAETETGNPKGCCSTVCTHATGVAFLALVHEELLAGKREDHEAAHIVRRHGAAMGSVMDEGGSKKLGSLSRRLQRSSTPFPWPVSSGSCRVMPGYWVQ